MEWTHLICVKCWNELRPEHQVEKEEPNNPAEPCCFCEGTTTSGIYVRHRADQIRCQGIHPEIIKVQLPVNASIDEVLIYNESRSRQDIVPLTPELAGALKGELKSFWYATWNETTEMYHIVKRAPWQEW